MLSANGIKLTSGEGDVLPVSRESVKGGMRNFIIDAGKSLKVELTEPP